MPGPESTAPSPVPALRPLRVAWISFFPLEWLESAPASFQAMPRGHPATWQRVLADEFTRRSDLEIHLLSLGRDYPASATWRHGGLHCHAIKTLPRLRAGTNFWYDTWLIRRRLRRLAPEVVHAWGSERGGATVAARLRTPALVTVQGLMTWMEELFPLTRYERIAARLERTSLRDARVATAESRFSTEYLRSRYPHLQVHHVELGAPWRFHSLPRRPRLAPRRFLYVAPVDVRKGADVAIRALWKLREQMPWELVMVGARNPGLEATLAAEGIRPTGSQLQFRGLLTSAQIAAEMEEAACLLCPTRADTGPSVAKEAAAGGLPIVGSKVGGLPDYVADGRSGFLFPAGDGTACAEAIQRLVSHPTLGDGRVEAGQLAAIRRYLAPDRTALAFEGLYRQLAGREKTSALRAGPPVAEL